MLTLFSRSSAVVAGMCLVAALGLVAATEISVTGLDEAEAEAAAINGDEVSHVALTARFGLAVDHTVVTGQTIALREPTPADLVTDLYQVQIPLVEELLVDVRRLGAEDEGHRRLVAELVAGWAAMRALLTDRGLTLPGSAALAEDLRAQHELFNADVEALVRHEAAAAGDRNEATSAVVARAKGRLLGTAGVVLALLVGLAFLGNRRIRREIDPVKDQAEFADSLQLTETEEGAHLLLQRRLHRVVPDSVVSVLNRNNSANRLEPMTDVSTDPGLAQRLEAAEPRSCLAIRSARVHDEDPDDPGLIGCEVCAACPGVSTCTPLTVGGEVIGSVLVTASRRPDLRQRRLVHASVAQAAPVLANLRNLAIAQLRAATDGLTGLPNKRSVADSLKRMFAQASRTNNPMAVVFLDLDHFKVLNDRFGHPAGDQALASVGQAMRSTLREGDFAGRNGGEEFAVILPNTDAAGAYAVAEKLRKAIMEVEVPGLDLELTASLGVAAYPEHAISPERLERLADAALYVAKRSGRNRVEIASGQPTEDPGDPVDAEVEADADHALVRSSNGAAAQASLGGSARTPRP